VFSNYALVQHNCTAEIIVRKFVPFFSAMALGLTPALALSPSVVHAQVFVNVQVLFGPPPLPVYVQPPLPGPDYVWLPGYWAWDDDFGDYFWVPGTWVLAPRPGLLWTPAWWGWDSGVYRFHPGYWGEHVGFYGGVNYGFGYTGYGYEGGYWNGPHFFYNTTVNRVTNINITNVYQKTVIVNNSTRVSFNGGPGGVQARPTPAQMAAVNEPHLQPTAAQIQHIRAAQSDRSLFATANHGAPPVAAVAQPARFSGPGIVRAQAPGGPLPRALQNGPVGRGVQAQQAAVRAAGIAAPVAIPAPNAPGRPTAPPTGERPPRGPAADPYARGPVAPPGPRVAPQGQRPEAFDPEGAMRRPEAYPQAQGEARVAEGGQFRAGPPPQAAPRPAQPPREMRPPMPRPSAPPAARPAPQPHAAPPRPAPKPEEHRRPEER
jgi:hypothetical protein